MDSLNTIPMSPLKVVAWIVEQYPCHRLERWHGLLKISVAHHSIFPSTFNGLGTLVGMDLSKLSSDKPVEE